MASLEELLSPTKQPVIEPVINLPFGLDVLYEFSAETQFFLVAILVFSIVFHITYSPDTADKAPAFLTTLGIFGTFVGIALGLLDFNTVNIQASVPALIDGIKTAVWASAFGIFAALTFKLRDIEGFKKRRKPKQGRANIDDLVAALNALQKTLVGNDEVSVSDQIKRARQEINDRMDQLSHAIDELRHSIDKDKSKPSDRF
jgi:ABC-type phosphate/phosphonate transport system permease subunit